MDVIEKLKRIYYFAKRMAKTVYVTEAGVSDPSTDAVAAAEYMAAGASKASA